MVLEHAMCYLVNTGPCLAAGALGSSADGVCCLQAYATASWLLVALIGRSLGLIYRGVRQSVMPRKQRRQGQQQQRQQPDMAW